MNEDDGGRRPLTTALAIALVVIQVILYTGSQLAVSAQGYVVLENPLDVPITFTVDSATVVLAPHAKINVEHGSTICIGDGYLEVHLSVGAKKVFHGWIADNVYVSSGKCVEAGNYTVVKPLFKNYYRIVVASKPPGAFYYSNWSEENSIIHVEVPRVIDNGSVRYVFTGWSDSSLPNRNEIEIPVVSPMTITANYKVLYKVRLLGLNNSLLRESYVAMGSQLNLLQLYYSQSIVAVNGTVRYRLAGFIVNNATYQGKNSVVTVNQPLVVEPVYVKEYYVEIVTPVENRTFWVPEGYNLTVNIPSEIKVNDTVKLEFTGWKNMKIDTTKFVLHVDKPVKLVAVYRAKYKVTVNSPLGKEEYWVAKGEELPLVLPARLPGVVYDRVLKYYIINAEKIPAPKEGLMLVKVDKPLMITAVYVVKSNWLHLLILLGFILAVVSLYIVFSMGREEGETSGEGAVTGQSQGTEPSQSPGSPA